MQSTPKIIELNETFNKFDTDKYIKSYMFIKGFAVAKNLKQTLIALAVARHFHNGQYRKDGNPYIIHPLKVCTTLISYGIDDDTTSLISLDVKILLILSMFFTSTFDKNICFCDYTISLIFLRVTTAFLTELTVLSLFSLFQFSKIIRYN